MDEVIKEQKMYMTTGHSDLERKYVNDKHNDLESKYINDKVLRLDTWLTQQ